MNLLSYLQVSPKLPLAVITLAFSSVSLAMPAIPISADKLRAGVCQALKISSNNCAKDRLFSLDSLNKIEELRVAFDLGSDISRHNEQAQELADLAHTARFPKLKTLALPRIDRRAFIAFIDQISLEEFPALQNLEVSHSGIAGRAALRAEGVRAIAWHPIARQLETLNLRNSAIGNDGALVIAQEPNLAGLKELRLDRNNLTGIGITHIGRSPHLRNLRVLELSQNEMDARSLASLASSAVLTTVEKLGLESIAGYNGTRDVSSGVLAFGLSAGANLRNLKSLSLRSNKLTRDALVPLLTNQYLALTELNLSFGSILVDGVTHTLGHEDLVHDFEYATNLGNLEKLYVGGISTQDLRRFLDTLPRGKLRALTGLPYNDIALLIIAQHPAMSQVESLNAFQYSGNRNQRGLTEEGLKALLSLRTPYFANLRRAFIYSDDVDVLSEISQNSRSFQNLQVLYFYTHDKVTVDHSRLASMDFPSLEELYFSTQSFADSDIMFIERNPIFLRLRRLSITRGQLSDDGIQRLRSILPNTIVTVWF